MRGKVNTFLSGIYTNGITPAYAGKSGNIPDVRYKYRGSPPPMRGKAFDANGDVTAAGITPAYAGKSL